MVSLQFLCTAVMCEELNELGQKLVVLLKFSCLKLGSIWIFPLIRHALCQSLWLESWVVYGHFPSKCHKYFLSKNCWCFSCMHSHGLLTWVLTLLHYSMKFFFSLNSSEGSDCAFRTVVLCVFFLCGCIISFLSSLLMHAQKFHTHKKKKTVLDILAGQRLLIATDKTHFFLM